MPNQGGWHARIASYVQGLPCRNEEHELDFCYGPDASTSDVYRRTLDPLTRKLVEGYNICTVNFGATGL